MRDWATPPTSLGEWLWLRWQPAIAATLFAALLIAALVATAVGFSRSFPVQPAQPAQSAQTAGSAAGGVGPR